MALFYLDCFQFIMFVMVRMRSPLVCPRKYYEQDLFFLKIHLYLPHTGILHIIIIIIILTHHETLYNIARVSLCQVYLGYINVYICQLKYATCPYSSRVLHSRLMPQLNNYQLIRPRNIVLGYYWKYMIWFISYMSRPITEDIALFFLAQYHE